MPQPKDQSRPERERHPLGRLFAHIKNPDQRESLIAAYSGLSKLLDESLRKELNRLIAESRTKTEREDIYESPNMIALLADQQGYRRALERVLNLLP
jgi:hypothetical protein